MQPASWTKPRNMIEVALILMVTTIILTMPVTSAYATLQPVRRANVYAKDANTQEAIVGASVYLDGITVGTTDSDGRFVIPSTYTGPHQLTVTKDGYILYETIADIKPSKSTFTADLPSIIIPQVSYTIFADNGKINARNGATGNIDFLGDDPAAVLQRAIDALASTGGSIFLTSGIYVWQSVPALPRNLPAWLRITGQDGATIQLTTAGPRAFDFQKVADYDTFQNIWIENLIIDCNSVGGMHHVVLGTYQNGHIQSRINIQNLIIRGIVTVNVPVDPSETNHRLNIHLHVHHERPGETQTYIKNVFIENCDFRGGNEGIAISGGGIGDVTGLNVFIDNVHIHNVRHSLLSVQKIPFNSANFQIGSDAFGGYAHISDCYGEYSGDVGVEIDAMNAVVENVVIKDAALNGFTHVNANSPENPSEQRIILKNFVVKKLDLSSQLTGRGFKAESIRGIALGTLILENCAFYSTGSSYATGEAIYIYPSNGMTSLVVENFTSDIEGVNKDTPGESRVMPIGLDVTGSTAHVTLKNVYLAVRGSRSTGTLLVKGIELIGTMALDAQGIILDFSVNNGSKYTMVGIDVGVAASALEGVIRKLRVQQMTGDSEPCAIQIRDQPQLIINNQLRIEECDFGTLTSAQAVRFENESQNRNLGIVFLSANVYGMS